MVALLFNWPTSAKRVVLPNVCWNRRSPGPGVALVSAVGPVIVITIAESAPELGEMSRTFRFPAVGPVPLLPQLRPAPTTTTAAAIAQMALVARLPSRARFAP